jgi:hypothetical protein
MYLHSENKITYIALTLISIMGCSRSSRFHYVLKGGIIIKLHNIQIQPPIAQMESRLQSLTCVGNQLDNSTYRQSASGLVSDIRKRISLWNGGLGRRQNTGIQLVEIGE